MLSILVVNSNLRYPFNKHPQFNACEYIFQIPFIHADMLPLNEISGITSQNSDKSIKIILLDEVLEDDLSNHKKLCTDYLCKLSFTLKKHHLNVSQLTSYIIETDYKRSLALKIVGNEIVEQHMAIT